MQNRTFIAAIALVIVAGLGAAGCETMAQSGGLGAGTGAIIGHQRGRAWEGAAIGAALGGVTGIIAHDIRERRTRTAEETAQAYNYTPDQGFELQIERTEVSPRELNPGQRGTASVEYYLLGASGGTEVMERRELRRGNQVISELSSQTVTRTNGTWVSEMPFDVPHDAEPGLYTMHQVVQSGGNRISGTATFEIVPR